MSSHEISKDDLEMRIQELATENQKLEAEKTALQDKANHLETVLDSMPDIVGIQSPDRTVHRFNQAGYDFLGKGPGKVNGRKCYHLIGRDKPCDECASQEAIVTTNIVEKEKYFPELDKHIKCCAVPVVNQSGNISYVVEILRDVTGRRKVEQALVESEERHRLAMQASRDGIWDWDITTDSVYFSPAYAIKSFLRPFTSARTDHSTTLRSISSSCSTGMNPCFRPSFWISPNANDSSRN